RQLYAQAISANGAPHLLAAVVNSRFIASTNCCLVLKGAPSASRIRSPRFSDVEDRLIVVEQKMSKIIKLRWDLSAVSETVTFLKNEINMRDGRLNNLEISGIPTSNKENLIDILRSMYVKVGLSFDLNEIDSIHRVRRYGSPDWNLFFGDLSLDECLLKFYDLCQNLFNKYVSRRSIKSSNSIPIWYTKPLSKLLNEKNKYHKRWKIYNNPLDEQTFKLLRKRANSIELDEMLDIFYGIVDNLIRQYVPMSRSCYKKYPPWFSKDLIRLLKEKYTWHLKVKKYKNPLDKITFNLLKNRCSKLQNICYKSYVVRLEESLKHNPKIFWSHAKLEIKIKMRIPAKCF
ncbi:unnamed protein product, partial [Leptidea sinapis]